MGGSGIWLGGSVLSWLVVWLSCWFDGCLVGIVGQFYGCLVDLMGGGG